MNIRNSISSASKIFVTLSLVISGIAATPAASQAAPGSPTITVTKTAGLNPNGELVTISGSGFVAAGALTDGTRPPLAGTFSGFYVTFGKFQDVWKPSVSAPSGNRKSAQSDSSRVNWLVLAANLATIGGAAAGGVELNADGTFSITLNVSDVLLSTANATIFDTSTIGNYGIYTYGASGANYAPFETYTPLAFATRVAASPSVATAPVVGSVAKTVTPVLGQIKFGSGAQGLTKANKRIIKSDIATYQAASRIVITATAGATSRASNKVAKSLAKKRANAVKKYLVAQGVPADKIVIKTKVVKSGVKPSTKVVATS
jgi:outer membrane protein OmpA-like peptidoglycan-associated protein